MELSLVILYAVFIVSIILLTIAGVIIAAFVIPLQYQQSKVKNGLILLRKLMLIKGMTALAVIVIAIFCLTGRFIITDISLLRYSITFMVFIFSAGILGKAVIDYKIYHQQYSEENKQLHAKIEKLERKEASKDDTIDKKNKK